MTRALAGNTARFERKRERILVAAQDILARRGFKGMTLGDVAAKVGLSAASLTYYFKKKDELAAACLLAGVARLEAMIGEAEAFADERARLKRMIAAALAHHRAVRRGAEGPIPSFGDIRMLEEPHRSTAAAAFATMARRARALFEGPSLGRLSLKAKTALTHLMLEQIFWAMTWLQHYDIEDYPRVLERACDLYFDGLGAPGARWRGAAMAFRPEPRGAGPDISREDFFIAATRLINRFGYRGASVERISAELNVTKGSFYHHNEAKEDLAAACFRRSIDVMRRVQRQALKGDGANWDKLERMTVTLIDFQMSESGPLAREGLLMGLPDGPRASLNERLRRVVDRFAGVIADGIADGSVRAVDPLIAAQMLKVAINAAAEGPSWVRGLDRGEAPALYARPTLMGVFAVAR